MRGSQAQNLATGVRPHPWCAHTLLWLPLDRLHVVGSWVGLGLIYISARPRFFVEVGLCLVLGCRICITLSGLRILFGFPLVFKLMTCKT